MADPHDNQHLFFLLSAGCWCTCLLHILGIYRFSKLRGLLIIQKRYPRLVISEAAVYCLVLSVVYPAWMSVILKYPSTSGYWWPLIFATLMTYSYQIAPTIETCRIWLISYDLQYLHSSKNQRWKTEIDASYAEKDWYLQNRGKWGNQKYMARLGFAYYFTTSTVMFASMLLVGSRGDRTLLIACGAALTNAFHIVHVALPFYLYMKIPQKLQEQLLFRYEFMLTAIILMTGTVFALIMYCLVMLNVWTLGWVLALINACYQTSPCLLSTFWIPRKISMMSEWNAVCCNSPTVSNIGGSSGSFREKLRKTLVDEHKCEAFIDWIYREFSSEVILSFLEFVQFKKYIKEQIGKICVTGDEDPYDFELYDGMPRSTIVYDSSQLEQATTPSSRESVASVSVDSGSATTPSNNTLMRCKRIAHLFFEKYIDYNSEHEINISGAMRNKYVKLEEEHYEAMELEQFVTIYDDLIAEMMKYLAESCRRFESANSD